MLGVVFEKFEHGALHCIPLRGDRASKSPMDILELAGLPERNIWNKRILVLVTIRDPRDLITSRHPMLPDQYFIGYDHSWWPGNKEFSEWKYDAPGIGEISGAIEEAKALEGIDLHIVRYEELVMSPDQVQEEIARRLDLGLEGKFSDFHVNKSRLPYRYEGRFSPRDARLVREDKAVDQTRAGKWKTEDHRARLVEQITSFPEIRELVLRYGYETNNDWMEKL